MADITPSKQVSRVLSLTRPDASAAEVPQLTVSPASQVAAAVDSLKMESPVKKLDFGVADKENNPDGAVVQDLAPVVEAKKVEEPKAAVAPGIKPEEADEPLLQENPNRYVLFPIQYHEVRLLPQPLHPRLCRRVPTEKKKKIMKANTWTRIDLADVQEARGVVLDRRGD